MPRPRFGFCLPIFAAPGLRLFRTPLYPELDTATTLDLATKAEALGYDSLWVADHLMLGKDDAILEGWTTLAALAGRTSRPKLGLIHQAHPFRHPSIAAKMIATIDQISGGRFIYFLDGGNRRVEYVAYGLPWSDEIAERAAWMVDGLKLALALWAADGPLDYDGPHYQLRGAVCNPPPVQRPHPPIWFGGVNPALLSACARYGQGWNTTPVSPAQLRDHLGALAAACAEEGRAFDELEKTLEIQILIAPDRAAIRERLRDIAALDPEGRAPEPALAAYIAGETDEPPPDLRRTTLIGTPDEVAGQVREFVDLGIDHFMLWFLDAPGDEGLRLFAERVLPTFRA